MTGFRPLQPDEQLGCSGFTLLRAPILLTVPAGDSLDSLFACLCPCPNVWRDLSCAQRALSSTCFLRLSSFTAHNSHEHPVWCSPSRDSLDSPLAPTSHEATLQPQGRTDGAARSWAAEVGCWQSPICIAMKLVGVCRMVTQMPCSTRGCSLCMHESHAVQADTQPSQLDDNLLDPSAWPHDSAPHLRVPGHSPFCGSRLCHAGQSASWHRWGAKPTLAPLGRWQHTAQDAGSGRAGAQAAGRHHFFMSFVPPSI